MTTLYVQSPTLYLAGSGVVIGATSITLTDLVDIYGNVLTMADFGSIGYITLEPDTTNSEAATFTGVTANANGTYTLTGVKTILAKSPYTQTSGLVRNHAGGTKVVITDNTGFWDTFLNKNNNETVVGLVTFPDGANRPVLAADTDTATSNALVTYGQLARTAIAGGTTASTTLLGYVKVSVNPASAASPIAVGDNDGRVPTQSENDALVGTSGTPSGTNKFVTNDDTDTAATASKIPRRSASGQITVPSTPSSSTDASSKSYVDSFTPLVPYQRTYSGIISTSAVGFATSQDGLTMFSVSGPTGNDAVVVRYAYDAISGMWYKTHSVNINVGGGAYAVSSGSMGVTVIGSYVYVSGTINQPSSFTWRLSSTDLTGGVAMTYSGGSPSTATNYRQSYTDGTKLFICSTTTTWKRYSISGTTLTYEADVTSISGASIYGAVYNGTYVYFYGTSGLISAYTTAGASSSSVTRLQLDGAATSAGIGVCSNKTTVMLLIDIISTTTLIIYPVTKP